MDISQIDDINTLKAMAFDEIRNKAAAETNLSIITARIQQLEIDAAAPEKNTAEDTKEPL